MELVLGRGKRIHFAGLHSEVQGPLAAPLGVQYIEKENAKEKLFQNKKLSKIFIQVFLDVPNKFKYCNVVN